jgi:hypothetical protein
VVPGALQNPPWNKSGQVAAWSAVLANDSTDNSSVWQNGSFLDLFAITTDTAGTFLEGVVDLEYLTGGSPATVYLAVGKYQTGNGGVLLAQAPVGNGDGNINANEFALLETPLPIQLASFTATPLTGGHVRLDWTTLSEMNNYGFEVQKSTGQLSGYVTIPNSFIPGHGTTVEPHYYSYTDTTTTPGRWWYRLKQIDLDGTIHYTDGIRVDVLTGVAENPLPLKTALQQNYPNPFNPSTTIRYSLAKPAFVSLAIYNTLGQEIATLVGKEQSAGQYSIEWAPGNVASGTYIYRLRAGDYVENRRLLILK